MEIDLEKNRDQLIKEILKDQNVKKIVMDYNINRSLLDKNLNIILKSYIGYVVKIIKNYYY